jgi:hypothetical protein
LQSLVRIKVVYLVVDHIVHTADLDGIKNEGKVHDDEFNLEYKGTVHQGVLEGFKSKGHVHRGGPGGIADVLVERTGDLDGSVGVGNVHAAVWDTSVDGSNVHLDGQGGSKNDRYVIREGPGGIVVDRVHHSAGSDDALMASGAGAASVEVGEMADCGKAGWCPSWVASKQALQATMDGNAGFKESSKSRARELTEVARREMLAFHQQCALWRTEG